MRKEQGLSRGMGARCLVRRSITGCFGHSCMAGTPKRRSFVSLSVISASNPRRPRFEKWNRRLGNEIPIDPSMRYLEVGCGMGEMSLVLAQYGCGHVTGIDKDPYYIEIAKRCARKAQLQDKVTFECMNVHDLPNEKEYDIVLSHEMLEHVERPGDHLRRMDGVLKSSVVGGVIILAFGRCFIHRWGAT